MKMAMFSIVFLMICSVGLVHASDNLWVNEVNIKSEKGKDQIMKFEELERAHDYSIARVQFTSGASVPSIMFVVNGFYTIAKQRGNEYFINLKEWRDENNYWMYKVGFVNSKEIDLRSTYGNDIKKDLDSEAFMSVSDYDLMWGGK